MTSPHFIALSLIVSGRWHDNASPNLSAMDCLAYAIERENDPPDAWPPLVERSLRIFDAARKGEG